MHGGKAYGSGFTGSVYDICNIHGPNDPTTFLNDIQNVSSEEPLFAHDGKKRFRIVSTDTFIKRILNLCDSIVLKKFITLHPKVKLNYLNEINKG